ncbi:hypothetical protein GQ600_4277 [Phytophthora cactorum]|nr:hypothetical protein GQ600_4277 [Phytophthora cactorum]
MSSTTSSERATRSTHSVQERLYLSQEEARRLEDLANQVVVDTTEFYDRFRFNEKRVVDPSAWKDVAMDGSLQLVPCKSAPSVKIVGMLQGTLDDEMYGCFVDSDDTVKMRTAVVNDAMENFHWLATIAQPTQEDPFRFCGVARCTLGMSLPLAKTRGACLVISMGMTTTKHGERMGYYVAHSVDLSEPINKHSYIRAKCSLCWLKTELSNGKVELYMKGFAAPMGIVPEFAAFPVLVSCVLGIGMTSDAAYSKKLAWMIHDAGQSGNRSPLPPMIECVGRCKSTFGGPKRVVEVWFALHLEHFGGKYSVERMLALEEYTRNTSLARVVLVTIGVPLLVIALVLCQESVPLQDPADGWEVNYGFWVRAGLVGVGIGNAASIQIGFWLDVPPFTLNQILGYCTLMATGYIAAGMIFASFWVFPIPFFMFCLCMVTTTVILVYIRLVVGAQGFRQIMSRREQLRRLNRVGTVQGIMYIVYPAYQILFTRASHSPYEIPVLTILPIVRLVLKLMFTRAAAHKEDMIPVQVVFTVDFFDAFYFASFIQSLSPLALAGVMATDLFQTASEIHELRQRARRILSRIRRLPSMELHSDDLLEAVKEMCNRVDILGIQILKATQVRSCIYHQLSDEGRMLLDKLERYLCTESCSTSYQHNLKTLSRVALHANFVVPNAQVSRADWIKCCCRGKVTVAPDLSKPPSVSSPKIDDILSAVSQKSSSRKQSAVNTSIVLQEALEVLFTSECLVLTEYMEVIVPTVYGIFVLTMVYLPSAKYHTELAGVNGDNVTNVVSRIFAYALMEFGSFVVLVMLKKRTCGINALYQLAFVLETQTLFVQSTLMMWILLTLTYRVVTSRFSSSGSTQHLNNKKTIVIIVIEVRDMGYISVTGVFVTNNYSITAVKILTVRVHILSQRENLRRLNRIGSLQGFMYVAYPAYQVLFSKANYTIYEIPVLLILPLFRLVVKVVFASAATHKEDMIPAQVVFTVDFFDAVYLVTSIQNVSTLALAAVMAVDLLQTATELHELHRQTRQILSRLHVVGDSTDIRDINLLVAIRELCSANVLDQNGLSSKSIQVRSCIYHQVSDEGRALLDRLESNSVTRSAVSSSPHTLKTIHGSVPELVHPPQVIHGTGSHAGLGRLRQSHRHHFQAHRVDS